MSDIQSCETCRFAYRECNEQPCVQCSNRYQNQWESDDIILKDTLRKYLKHHNVDDLVELAKEAQEEYNVT